MTQEPAPKKLPMVEYIARLGAAFLNQPTLELELSETEGALKMALDQYGNPKPANDSVMPAIPINLRNGVQITIIGLPKDFHEGEAAYVAAILSAYAKPIQEPEPLFNLANSTDNTYAKAV